LGSASVRRIHFVNAPVGCCFGGRRAALVRAAWFRYLLRHVCFTADAAASACLHEPPGHGMRAAAVTDVLSRCLAVEVFGEASCCALWSETGRLFFRAGLRACNGRWRASKSSPEILSIDLPKMSFRLVFEEEYSRERAGRSAPRSFSASRCQPANFLADDRVAGLRHRAKYVPRCNHAESLQVGKRLTCACTMLDWTFAEGTSRPLENRPKNVMRYVEPNFVSSSKPSNFARSTRCL